MKWILDKLLKRKKGEKLICQYCKEEIKDPAFVLVRGEIITNSRNPRIFTCPEHAFNYAQGIVAHSVCWMKILREYGTKLYDMDKVYAEYNRRKKGAKFNQKASGKEGDK